MSTLSRPTSSSDHPSPPLTHLSSSSSSSSSSTTDSLSVRVAEVPLQVEVVRGDDPVNDVFLLPKGGVELNVALSTHILARETDYMVVRHHLGLEYPHSSKRFPVEDVY